MRSHKFWYSALWLCSKVLYKPDWYISFVSIFNHLKSKWKSLHWLNFSSWQLMLCQLMICPSKCQPKKNGHLTRLWTVSPEAIRRQCWSKIKSVWFLQVKSSQFKTFWSSNNDTQFCSIIAIWKLRHQKVSCANDLDGKPALFTADWDCLRLLINNLNWFSISCYWDSTANVCCEIFSIW